VLEHEKGNYDHIVFGGDIIDSHDAPPAVSGARETARWYARLIESPNTTVLMGNHDLPQFESHSHSRAHRHKRPLFNACSGFTHSKAIEFAKEMTHDLWRKVRLFCVANGWLLSHAGIQENSWQNHLAAETNLDRLWNEADEALEAAPFKPHRLFACGYNRGGDANYGGPLWLDWDTEFEDVLPYPQIVGHTHKLNAHRRIGRSWCIDSGTGYVIIAPDGTVEHKRLWRARDWNKDDGYVWISGIPTIRDDTEHAFQRKRN
jgi:DNA repair exonuclease SbcCD nuclease subunit